MKKFVLGIAMAAFLAGNADAATISYSKETINRVNTFRLGSTKMQGQVIRLSKAKLQALKGKTIDFAEFVVGSRNTTDKKLRAFITTSLDAAPIAEDSVAISKAFARCKWTLSKPYTITGEEENLYIGYTAEIGTSYKMLMSDGSYDIKGYNFAYQNGEWVDTYGLNRGSAQIFVNVADAPAYTDVIMGRSSFDGYFKVGDNCEFSARFINAGTAAINSFDAVVTVGGNTSTQHVEGVNIKPKDAYSFKLSGVNSDEEGEQNINVEIAHVNGSEDIDLSDNTVSGAPFFYPRDMERSILVEGFTGQDCSNCPSGHLVLNNALASSDESLIEVSHHAGFYPDMFTMQEDDAYRFYYNNPVSTYAPAVMVNRNMDSSVGIAPVIEVDHNNILQLISHAAQSKPYVSLNLETQLDENTRELKVKFGIKPHTNLPEGDVLYNVFLVQDSIYRSQTNGGSNYLHNRVFRGAVTGNSWGILVDDLTPGKVYSWEKTVTIPDSIHSSYWTDDMIDKDGKMYSGKYLLGQTNIEAILKNMTVVAYVAQYNKDDNTKNIIYNCCEARLGQSYTQKGFGKTPSAAIRSMEEKPAVGIRVVDGRINVEGDYDKVSVFNLAGRQTDASAQLAKGAYIIRVVSGDKQTTKKIIVR